MVRPTHSSNAAGSQNLAAAAATLAAIASTVAILAWWAVQILAPRPAIAPAARPALTQADPASAAALFGATGSAARMQAPARLASVKVLGVVVHPQRSAALLAVDGAAPRAFTLGDSVSPGLTLVAVTADTAVFERGAERFELPAPRRSSPELLQGGPAPAKGSGGH
jgi:general secretion pathway protein C